ncbi:hypothetical protein CT0861_07762, partial [Colletotrichum tofieldiae]
MNFHACGHCCRCASDDFVQRRNKALVSRARSPNGRRCDARGRPCGGGQRHVHCWASKPRVRRQALSGACFCVASTKPDGRLEASGVFAPTHAEPRKAPYLEDL